MAYPKQFLRLTFGFTLVGSLEVADTGLHITTLGGAAFDALAALAAATSANETTLRNAYVTMASAIVGWADYSRLTSVKLAACDTAGVYLGPPLLTEYTTGGIGTTANVKAQATEVLTLWSGLTFGRANYGRMYLPHMQTPNESASPYTATVQQAGLSTAGATFIRAVNTMANSWTAGAGVVNLSKVGSGLVKAVADVRVGRVGDTQRRRRNRLTEEYITTAI